MANLFQLNTIGARHMKSKHGVNQDHIVVSQLEDNNNVIVASIADGMGSCIHADYGARFAAGVCTRRIKASLKGKTGEEFDAAVERAVEGGFNAAWGAIDCQDAPREYLATLITVVADTKRGVVWYGFVGDGGLAVATQGEDGADIRKLERRQKGSAWNETLPVYGGERWAPERAWRFGKSDFDVILACTDGVYDAICDDEWPDPNLNDDGLALMIKALEGCLSEEDFEAAFPEDISAWRADSIAKRCTDDRTALLIVADRVADVAEAKKSCMAQANVPPSQSTENNAETSDDCSPVCKGTTPDQPSIDVARYLINVRGYVRGGYLGWTAGSTRTVSVKSTIRVKA